MLQIPLWKRVVIWGLVALGVLFAIPDAFYMRVEHHNDAVKKLAKGAAPTPKLIAWRDGWPGWMPSALVNLGLDLRGGAHLLGEVQVKDVYAQRMDTLWLEVLKALRKGRATIGTFRRLKAPPGELRVRISNPAGINRAEELIRGLSQPVVSLTSVGARDLVVKAAGDTVTVTLSAPERQAIDKRTVQQSLEIIRRRIDAVGTREPTIQSEGNRRILIEVPGIGSAAELKKLIGTTARLTFNAVVGRTSDPKANPGVGNLLLPSQDNPGTYYIVKSAPVVTGGELNNAQPAFDRNGQPSVNFQFNPAGARKFGRYTGANVGSPFAIVLDGKVISAPVIREAIPGGSGQITGNFTVAESTRLAVLLRAGALPAKMIFLEERTIGPQLGQDSINAGRIASVVAMVAVVAYMIATYGLFGLFADIALAANMVMLFGLLSVIGATLTLPGIAGIVLTIGMAVDANVLIFERIREELRTARGPARAIELGYERALSAILDGNITTFITAVILFVMGSGPVRGFAVTLSIGIVTSVFTAVYVTRVMVVMWFERRRPRTITV